jgi:hypothetical protein
MAMIRNSNSRRSDPRLSSDFSDLVRTIRQAFSDTYHPELHYMRGPGPKWHAKHDRPEVGHDAVPALVRVKA